MKNFVLVLLICTALIGACGTPTPAAPAPTQAAIVVDTPALPPTATAIPPTEIAPPEQTSTSTPTPLAAAEPQSPAAGIVASFKDLPLDEFFQESFNQLLLRNPEMLTELNLSAQFGLRNDRLTNLSDVYVRETQQLEAAILDLLRTYDRDELNREQQISYDVYEWYLDNQVRGHEFMYNDYPLHHFIRSYHFNLDALFGEIHPLATRQDAEDYISRLAQVDDQVEQVLAGLELREEAGVIPPKFIVDLAKTDMRNYLQMRSPDSASIKAEALPIYTRFDQALAEMEELNAEEQQAFREAALLEIKESFIPGYLKLIDYLDYLQPLASNDAGVWKLPNGNAYYAHMLRQETSTDLTPDQIHELGLTEVERLQAEMRAAFAELGYPENESLGESMQRAIDDGGYYNIADQAGKDEYVAAIEAILAGAEQKTYDYFDLRPQAEVVLVAGPMGGYYVPGTPDGSRPGAYHVGTVGSWRAKFNMQTIAYHEAIPGHHFQIALAQEMDLPSFRNYVDFNGYAEGWALYAERLAWEMGLYEDEPYGNIGRLQLELLRAARLVTDTGIHAKQWTREQAKTYMKKALGDEQGRWAHEVERYIVLPAQATGYKIGMLKILELRQKAMDRLGDQFDIKEFHNVVLGDGSLPLDILEQVVDDYVEAKVGAPSPSNPALAGRYQKPGNFIDSILVNSVERWFTVHLPPGFQPDVDLPLVLNLHPYSGTAFSQEALSGMNAKADEAGFVVVNPQALNDPPSWHGPLPGASGQQDRDFVKKLVDYLQSELPIDAARIYATGLSNGGTMSHMLGCTMPDVFAAIAPVAGGHVAHDQCPIERPISVLVIHGTDDQVIPYDGNGIDSPPVHTWLQAWALRNGCAPKPQSSQPFESVTQETWGDCEENVEVTLYTLKGGGHVWPGGPSGGSFPYMNATDAIWEFFAAHPKSIEPSE